MRFPVGLTACTVYDLKTVRSAAATVLDGCGAQIPAQSRVLIKPNLVAATNATLATTHPVVVRAACELALDAGAREVLLGDSPAFGSAVSVARASGLERELAELTRGSPVRIVTLGKPKAFTLPCGIPIGLSTTAMEADFLINLPRLKAHNQLLVSAAVKNLFGCVCGFRKALAHAAHGDEADRFRQLLLDVALAMPPGVSLLDGVIAMHRRGPMKGDPYPLGLVAAAADPVALDTAVYSILGLGPDHAPLAKVALGRGMQQANPAALAYPLAVPRDFEAAGFELPDLEPETFHPWRLIKGRIKSLLARYQ